MRAILELPWLFLLNLWNHFYTLGLWLQEIQRYYRYPPLIRADLTWMLEYAWQTPFAMSRQATRQQRLAADLTVYGETPWHTLEVICREVQLAPDDVFVELGCGTCRNLLFVPLFFDCRAIGYELVEKFVAKSHWLLHINQLAQSVDVFCQNWFEADLQAGTVFFLVGTCYSDAHLSQAADKLRTLPVGVRIITVSWPLPGQGFVLEKQCLLPFSWGAGTVYFQRRVAESGAVNHQTS